MVNKKRPEGKEYTPSRRDVDVYNLCENSKLTQREIAKQFGISHQMVSKIRARMLEWTRAQHCEETLRVKAKVTNRLEWVALEAIEAYLDSKKTKRKTRKKKTSSQKNGKSIEQEDSLEESYGDPRFLDVILKSEALKAKLWGLDQPPEDDQMGMSRVAGSSPEAAGAALQESLLLHIENLPGGIKFLANMVAKMPQLAPLMESMQAAQQKTLEGQVIERPGNN